MDTVAEDVAIVDVDEAVINQGLDHSPSWQDHGGHWYLNWWLLLVVLDKVDMHSSSQHKRY